MRWFWPINTLNSLFKLSLLLMTVIHPWMCSFFRRNFCDRFVNVSSQHTLSISIVFNLNVGKRDFHVAAAGGKQNKIIKIQFLLLHTQMPSATGLGIVLQHKNRNIRRNFKFHSPISQLSKLKEERLFFSKEFKFD